MGSVIIGNENLILSILTAKLPTCRVPCAIDVIAERYRKLNDYLARYVDIGSQMGARVLAFLRFGTSVVGWVDFSHAEITELRESPPCQNNHAPSG